MKEILDSKIQIISKEEAKRFLEEEVARVYNSANGCFSGTQKWAEDYEGKFRDYLGEVIKYLEEKNKKGNRIFGIGALEIEDILNATFLPK